MAKRKRPSERLYLDMPFAEAVERYANASPEQMHANIARSKQKKPPGDKRKKRKPSGGNVRQNVVKLRNFRRPRSV